MKTIASYRRWFGLLRICLSKVIFGLIPKDRTLILFNSWFGDKYADNCKYVYEYLIENSNYKVYWLTKNAEVFNKLKSEGKPVLMYNSFNAKWKQARCAAACSSTQLSDFNQWFLSRSILLDLNHGYPFKKSDELNAGGEGQKIHGILLKFLRYYAIMPSEFCRNHYDVLPISVDRIFVSDFARNDVYFDAKLREGINTSVETIKSGRRALVYMPTHRNAGASIMDMHTLLPLNEIEHFCEENGWEFIIKKHYYHRGEEEDFSKFKHIHDITNDLSIDSQVILYQADVLISDYSSSYIDFLLLDRPLIFYHYDLNYFLEHERNIIIPFDKLDFCPRALTKEDLFVEIKDICTSSIDKYAQKRHQFTPTYFENQKNSDGRKKTKAILDRLIRQYYY